MAKRQSMAGFVIFLHHHNAIDVRNWLIPALIRVEDAKSLGAKLNTGELRNALENLSQISGKAVDACDIVYTPQGELQTMMVNDFKNSYCAAANMQTAAEGELGALNAPGQPADSQTPKQDARCIQK